MRGKRFFWSGIGLTILGGALILLPNNILQPCGRSGKPLIRF